MAPKRKLGGYWDHIWDTKRRHGPSVREKDVILWLFTEHDARAAKFEQRGQWFYGLGEILKIASEPETRRQHLLLRDSSLRQQPHQDLESPTFVSSTTDYVRQETLESLGGLERT